MIEIYGRDNSLKCRIEPGSNSQQDKTLGGDNLLSLSFVHYDFVQLDVNDYCEFEGERYWLQERYLPTQKSEGEWSYDVKLYGIESLIKRLLVLKNPDGENEAVFTLTAPAADHVRLIVGSINAGMGNSANWKMGAVMATENLTIDYNGTYCDEGLRLVAEAAKTEWWVEGQTVNVCRCEHGEELTLRYPESITQLERDTADGAKFYTRLFPMGSSRNIDRAKYGSVRLQLPGGRKYVDMNVDKYGIFHHYEEAAFSAIYPRRVGTVSEVRETTVKGNDGKPFKIYWFKDGELPFNPNEYEIGGLVKHVVFQSGELNGRDFEVNYHAGSQEFEIITTWPYSDDIQLPGGTLVPKSGDKYILWNIRMPDEYYGLAEQEYLEAVEAFNAKHCIDTSVYKCPTHHVWVERNNVQIYVGRKIRLENEQYFPEAGFRSSRITRISRSVALPSQMDIEISDATSTGAMTRITDSINETKRYAREALGALPDIIRSGDTTKPTDTNLYSARRTHKEFLSKNSPDTARELITFLRGIALNGGAGIDGAGNAILKAIQTLGFERTINGFGVWLDEKGCAHGQIDYLEVIGKAIFRSLQIDEYKHIGGNIVLSGANAIIEKVVPVTGGWKCYLHTDDGDKAITNDWEAGDQALCQTFNIKAGVYENVSNTYYWRCVSEVGQKTDTEEAYIVITDDDAYRDKSIENDEPKAGDNVVLCGHNTLWDIAHGVEPTLHRNRMNVTMITTSKEEGGTIEVYRNIHDFSLNKGNAIFHLSSDKIYMNSRHFEWISSDGERIPNVLYRGDWLLGTVAAKYEAWYRSGGTWLSLVDGNTDEPTEQSPKWKKYAAKGEDGTSPYTVQIHSERGGNVIHNGQGEIAMVATVFHGEQDITNSLLPNQFSWVIQSGNTDFDRAWNARHEAIGNRTTISAEEVNLKAQIDCIVNIDR
ncbi:hypothetical protein [Prevotella disiens]|uniref:Prophage tail endopeptidase domain-containing protein n=1 Tax=Prevotella disiens DNF00882 TaxID=1401075 RepID=A0A096C0K1_9BACT|nr:hypothetical protein [Prevotella disiens]KGF48547.1 hypothetical protein HMPREF0654_08945 [Prevotella disiens DNF00882]